MDADRLNALRVLQANIKRRLTQPQYQRFQQASRANYDEATLKTMAKPFRADELKAAWTDYINERSLYGKPVSRLKKHEVYHELLNINYNFNNLTRQEPRRRTRPAQEGAQPARRRGRPRRVP